MTITSNLIYKYQNKSIYSYTLTNKFGLRCSISNYGATIMSLDYPKKNNKLQNLALGFKDFETYVNNSLYAGATLGPNAGRLSKGVLPVKNEIFTLSQNDNKNNLHGGFNNISFQIWTFVKEILTEDSSSIIFSLNIPDGQDGFPGNRTISATFTLTNTNELKIKYEAISHRDTYLNLSNHCYFNLSGNFKTSVLDHSLSLKADTYLENDESHCAFKLNSVKGTPFDFRKETKIKSHIDAFNSNPQLLLGKGYNNCFCLNNKLSYTTPDLILKSPQSDIILELFTDAPSIVLYTGGYIEEGLLLNDGSFTKPNCAIAIEAQDYPNSPNLPFVKTSILHKGERYERNIIYKFKF